MDDVAQVGGKNASLGEMIGNLSKSGIQVPGGFATTANAYREFIKSAGIDTDINSMLTALDVDDVNALSKVGTEIRQRVIAAELPQALQDQILLAYNELGTDRSVAVRSSATAEDLPEASFAGQQESFLNVSGEQAVLSSVKQVFASLYNDRAISYRVHQGFDHSEVALSAGIQRMVRSDTGASGVMFTMDTESGFRDAIFITSSWGLGECVVQGSVNPDEYYAWKPALSAGRPAILRRVLGQKQIKMVYSDAASGSALVETVDVDVQDQRRFSLSDEDVEALGRMAMTIESHYGRPMDIEWGKDGEDGSLYILQARPETVESRTQDRVLERYVLNDEKTSVLATGRAIGQRIGAGRVRVVPSLEYLDAVKDGDVLVTDMTDPDWEPVMKRAAAIVTNRGGRTCHAAIIARELGVPAVVGCNDATTRMKDANSATVVCSEGDTGHIYDGELAFEIERTDLDEMPEIGFKIAMNVANPERAFSFARLPNEGVGLARLEFIISNSIGVHPRALLEYDSMSDEVKADIDKRMAGFDDPVKFYIEKLKEGVGTIAAAFSPKPVIVRLSDFKSNEYANLIGGDNFEPDEENPMIGFRGAGRYVDESFRPCFEMECQALKELRETMGLENIWIMVPFVRTLNQADQVLKLLADNGLERGVNDLKIVMMCEVPSNAILAEEFLERFDGFSIGSNDLTQLTLGLDRDSGLVARLFDERDPAVKRLLHHAIQACRKQGKYVGICGQGPSDFPDFARWLMEEGIDSVSLNPDTVIETWVYLAGSESH